MKQKLLNKIKKKNESTEEQKGKEETAEDLEDFLDDLIWEIFLWLS